MPIINGVVTQSDSAITTFYSDTALTTTQTFSFPEEQDTMTFINKGSSTLILTVMGKTYKIPSYASINIDDDNFTSFDVISLSTSQKFEITSHVKLNKIRNLNLQLADKANKTDIQNISKGSPSGVYATLSALQTAYPIGNSNVYVVTADGKWYFWNGSAWTVGGTYQSTGIADGSVTLAKQSQDTIDYFKRTKISNILLNTNFPDLTSWSSTLVANASASGGEATFTANARLGQIKQNTGITSTVGDKYYVAAMVKATTGKIKLDLDRQSTGATWGVAIHSGSGNYELLSFVAPITDVYGITFKIFDDNTSGWQPVYVKQPVLVNLTKIFGVGKEPSKEDFEAMLTKYTSNLYIDGFSYLPLILGDYGTLMDTMKIKPDKLTFSNKVINGNFATSNNWVYNLASGSVANNEVSLTATAKFGAVYQDLGTSKTGNVYYVSAKVKATSNLAKLQLYRSDSGNTWGEALHSGSGSYETLSFICTPTVDIGLRVRVIDYNTSGWASIQATGITVLNLTEIFGAGNEPTLLDVETMIKKSNSNNIFFDGQLLSNVITSIVYAGPTASAATKPLLPLFVNRTGDIIKVNSKYNDTQDLRVTLQKKGTNNIFDFSKFELISNSAASTTEDMISGTLLLSNGTDFLGPHIVKAINNITGELPSNTDFTGGNHGFNGDSTGSSTGRTASVDLFVDGRKVSDFSGYANYIDVYWVNYLQASNTKKSDGTGREVLQENYHLHFDGTKWTVRNRIEFLEDVSWQRYYGIQILNTPWNSSIFYHSSTNRKWNALNVDTNSTDKRCNKMTLRKNNDYAEMSLSESLGIGNKEFQTAVSYGAFSTTLSKTYFYMVSGSNSFLSGDVVSYEGSYKFYSR